MVVVYCLFAAKTLQCKTFVTDADTDAGFSPRSVFRRVWLISFALAEVEPSRLSLSFRGFVLLLHIPQFLHTWISPSAEVYDSSGHPRSYIFQG